MQSTNNEDLNNKDPNKDKAQEKPDVNEVGGIHISGHVKIFDPNSEEVFLSKREDD